MKGRNWKTSWYVNMGGSSESYRKRVGEWVDPILRRIRSRHPWDPWTGTSSADPGSRRSPHGTIRSSRSVLPFHICCKEISIRLKSVDNFEWNSRMRCLFFSNDALLSMRILNNFFFIVLTRQRCWTISDGEILETRVVDYNYRSLTLRCFQGAVLVHCAFAEFVVHWLCSLLPNCEGSRFVRLLHWISNTKKFNSCKLLYIKILYTCTVVCDMVVVGVLRQYPWLSEWVTPGDTAIPGMTSLKEWDLQHLSALAQSPKEI